jgi:hypothetical protein
MAARLKALNNVHIDFPEIPNEDEDFACPICFEEYEEKNIMPLDSCDHVFHEDCLKEYLEMKINNKDAVILCPDAKCKVPMVMEDLTAVLS